MINSSREELVEYIKSLGLTTYEARAYASLLLYGTLTSTEIASKSEIPQPRVYDVIKGLMEKGLVAVIEGRPKRFVTLNPEYALKNYIEKRFLLENNIYNKIIDSIKNKITIKEEGVWLTSSNSGIMTLIEQSIKDADYELLIAASSDIINQVSNKFNKKDVSICVVMYDEDQQFFEKFKDNVDELRLRPTKGPFLFIPDMKYALVVVRLGTPFPIAYKVLDEHLKALFIEYFLGYVRQNSLLLSSKFKEKREGVYVNLVRAIDHLKVLMASNCKLKLIVEGKTVKKREEVKIEGTPISFEENHIKSIASLHLITNEGVKISVGGLNAYIEDVEAYKITIKCQD